MGAELHRQDLRQPARAYALWSSRSPHWYADGGKVGLYDKGGVLRHGDAAVNRSGHPERVLDPQQTRMFERLLANGRDGGDVVLNVSVDESKGHARDQVEAAMFELRRHKRGGRQA